MGITHNPDKSSLSYTMGVEIKPVKCVKDLGGLISYDLTCAAQVDVAVNKDKANKILGIVYRTIGPTNQEAFSSLCITLVRPILEYAAPVWCPYLVKNVLVPLKRYREGHLALRLDRESVGEMEYEELLKF